MGSPRRRLPRALFSVLMIAPATTALAPSAVTAEAPLSAERARHKLRGDLAEDVRAGGDAEREVIVVLAPGAGAAQVRSVQGDDGGERFSVIPAYSATVDGDRLAELAADPRVGYVEPVVPVRASLATARKWTGVDAAHSLGHTGGDGGSYSTSDQVIAVIDSGISPAHQELAGKVIAFADCRSTCVEKSAFDDHGHGTHVAATAAGAGVDPALRGVAPGAALVGVKVINASGGGTSADVVRGIDWAVSKKVTYGVDIINLSLGVDCNPCSAGEGQAMIDAVDRASAAGVVVVAAAGNEGPNLNTVSSPGAAATAITVGAVADLEPGLPSSTGQNDPNAGWHLASFSSRGPTFDGRAKPDLVAPGVAIRAACAVGLSGCPTSTSAIAMSGTSMASPFVAGAVALLLAADPTLTPAAVRANLTSTADRWGSDDDLVVPGHQSYDYGAGRIDVAAAVAAVADPDSVGPVQPVKSSFTGSIGGTGQSTCVDITVDTDFPFAATMLEPDATTATDLDAYLVQPSTGTLIDTSESPHRQDTVGAPAGPSAHRLHLVSFKGSTPYEVHLSNAIGLAACPADAVSLTGFTAVDASAVPAAAEPGFTNGGVRYEFTSQPSIETIGGPTHWMVTSTPGRPAASDPGWNSFDGLTETLTGDGSRTLYPWVKSEQAGTSATPAVAAVSSTGDAQARAVTMTVDTEAPAIGAAALVGSGYLRATQTASVTWSGIADTNLKTQPVSLSTSAGAALAGPLGNSGSGTFTVPDGETSTFALRVTATDRAGNQASTLTGTRYVMAAGGYWVDAWGGAHRIGAVPAIDESRRFGFDIARGIAVRPGTEGGYVLDGFGGLHRFRVGSGPLPPALLGGPYWAGWDIARDVAVHPAGGAYVLDGFGGIHATGGAPAASGTPYFGFDIAEQILLLPDGSGGYVLDGFGGLHGFRTGSSPLPPKVSSAPYFGFDIARGATLLPGGVTGYVLDGYGATHPIAFGGAAVPPGATGGPYWPGWDITRGIVALAGGNGGSVLDAFGGAHRWNVKGKPAAPPMPSTGYIGRDGARAVTTR